MESRELRAHLHKAIDELGAQYRLLITLRYQNELSYEEIARTLNLPLGTVKTGLFRAKEQLRLALQIYQESSWIAP
jgi:RNA polymerase sigma-70 factor (ECF subfamily)